ncbi:MAG: hypothetical protein ABFR19_04200 [Pseudomonadota bacterium]
MIRAALLFIIGITLVLVTFYDWRIALRITIPVALIISSLIGLDMYKTNHERQLREAQITAREHPERTEKTATHSSPAEVQGRKEKAGMELQRIKQAKEERRLAEDRKATIKSFFANNRSLIEVYFHSASMCHSSLMFKGKMEDNAHCQTAIEAKDELQQITESLVGISKEELKKEDSTTMWRIEYAENQMEYAYQRSKHRK